MCEVVWNVVTFVSPAQNIMTFNKCSIQGKPYGDPVDQYGNPMDVTNVSDSQTREHCDILQVTLSHPSTYPYLFVCCAINIFQELVKYHIIVFIKSIFTVKIQKNLYHI